MENESENSHLKEEGESESEEEESDSEEEEESIDPKTKLFRLIQNGDLEGTFSQIILFDQNC
jgi:hypothetical protein